MISQYNEPTQNLRIPRELFIRQVPRAVVINNYIFNVLFHSDFPSTRTYVAMTPFPTFCITINENDFEVKRVDVFHLPVAA